MEFRELKSLTVLAESGSLSQTARLVHLSPAAIHKQLKHLEEELRVPLYERKDGRLRLTPAAELLLPYLRDILGQYESAVGALEEWRGVRRGLLRIGAGPTLATYLLPPILNNYYHRFPKVDLDIQTGSSVQLLTALLGGSLDLALVVAPESLEEPALQVVLEMPNEIVLVSSLKEAPRTGTLGTLSKYPFVLFRKGTRIENLIEHYWAGHGHSPNVIMRCDSAEALKALLLDGIGISMLPLYSVEEDIRAGRLRRIKQREAPLMMKIHLLARKSGYKPPAATEFIRMAKTFLAGSRG